VFLIFTRVGAPVHPPSLATFNRVAPKLPAGLGLPPRGALIPRPPTSWRSDPPPSSSPRRSEEVQAVGAQSRPPHPLLSLSSGGSLRPSSPLHRARAGGRMWPTPPSPASPRRRAPAWQGNGWTTRGGGAREEGSVHATLEGKPVKRAGGAGRATFSWLHLAQTAPESGFPGAPPLEPFHILAFGRAPVGAGAGAGALPKRP
jgi:hypothetical protein